MERITSYGWSRDSDSYIILSLIAHVKVPPVEILTITEVLQAPCQVLIVQKDSDIEDSASSKS
jgi:hypothetical protein